MSVHIIIYICRHFFKKFVCVCVCLSVSNPSPNYQAWKTKMMMAEKKKYAVEQWKSLTRKLLRLINFNGKEVWMTWFVHSLHFKHRYRRINEWKRFAFDLINWSRNVCRYHMFVQKCYLIVFVNSSMSNIIGTTNEI